VAEQEEREPWVMPAWMEPYRELIVNTGGNPVEELINDEKTNAFTNVVRAGLIVAVYSQVRLLTALHQRGLLAEVPAP
jgi:hypothetical protein